MLTATLNAMLFGELDFYPVRVLEELCFPYTGAKPQPNTG